MKKTILFLLACTAGLAQSVEVRRNLTAPSTVLGAVAGAIIGNNSGHHNGAQGALIGAAAGAILGNAASQTQYARPPRYYRPPSGRGNDPVMTGAVLGGLTGAIIGHNSGRGHGGRGALYGAGIGALLGSPGRNDSYYYYQPAPAVRYYSQPSYSSYDRSPRDENPAVSGAVFGGLLGAIIGNNSGHGHGGRGALIGAGIGALLGAASEPAPRYERDYYREAPRQYVQRVSAPQSVTIINNYYVSNSPASGGYHMDAPADGR